MLSFFYSLDWRQARKKTGVDKILPDVMAEAEAAKPSDVCADPEKGGAESVTFKLTDAGNIQFDVEEDHEDCVRQSTTFSFKENNFFATYWRKKDTEPKNVIFLVHGYGEYINFAWHPMARYKTCNLPKNSLINYSSILFDIRYLVDECGSLVVSHDHVGHGRSSGTRVHVESMDEYVDPVVAHLEYVRQHYPSLKVFLYGHSMGGLISLFTIFKKQEWFSGFVACGPLVMVDPDLATPFLRLVFLQDKMSSFGILSKTYQFRNQFSATYM